METYVKRLVPKEIKRITLLLLGILFLSYVVGDYLTTSWLIHNDPAGIENESNPVAATLYRIFGHPGLLIAKLAAFIAIGSVVYFVEMRFPDQARVNKLKKVVLLVLIGYSLLIVLNNIYAIFTLGVA
jgi:hypothetical protein